MTSENKDSVEINAMELHDELVYKEELQRNQTPTLL